LSLLVDLWGQFSAQCIVKLSHTNTHIEKHSLSELPVSLKTMPQPDAPPCPAKTMTTFTLKHGNIQHST